MLDRILEIATSYHYVIVAGDFNVNMLSMNSSHKAKVINLLHCYNMKYTIMEPTRVLRENISDHYALSIDIEIESKNNRIFENKRIHSSSNYNIFYYYLTQETWLSVYEAQDVNKMYNEFIEIIIKYFDLCFPIRKVEIKKNSRTTWITEDIYNAKETLNLLHELYLQKQIPKLTYTNYKNYYTFLLNQEKRITMKKKIRESDNKNKMIWNIINSESGKTKYSTNDFQRVKDENGIMVTSPGIACELYNNFYVNTVNRLVGAIPENSGLAHIPINNSSIFLRKTTNEEVLEIVREDHISNITLKRIICFVIEPLTYIINASLEEGVFPDKLKIATIKPIPKKGDSTIIENTRPVSILSSFSKIFEMEMKIRLVSFLEAHSIINPNQHGYQKK
nr:unnamed protein product [Callosobruchus analis]